MNTKGKKGDRDGTGPPPEVEAIRNRPHVNDDFENMTGPSKKHVFKH